MGLIIRSSDIHAAGCYTTSLIRKGRRVAEYTGDRMTVEEGDERYRDKPYTYLFGLEDGKHVVDGYGMAMYINHSCDPNCETEQVKGRIWIVAIRDIQPGEEITYDYNLYDGDGDAPCFCGSKKCRGTMYAPAEIRRRAGEKKKRIAERKKRTATKGSRGRGKRHRPGESRRPG